MLITAGADGKPSAPVFFTSSRALMKISHYLLGLSLLANLGLATALLWPTPEGPATFVNSAVTPREDVKNTLAAATPTVPSFHWRQLDTSDFAGFVKNLRAIGCPELTIRDIVKGELDEIYALKKQNAVANQAGAQANATLQQLQAEQDQLLANLIAPHSSAGEHSVSGTLAVQKNPSKPQRDAARPPQVPAAYVIGSEPGAAIGRDQDQFVLLNPAIPDSLPPNAKNAINQMRAEFEQALSTSVEHKTDQDSVNQWNQARQQSDERFRLLFGGEAFVRAQLQAVQAAQAAASSPK